MRGEFSLKIPLLRSSLLISMGDNTFFVPEEFLSKVDNREPIPVFHQNGGCSAGSISFNNRWVLVTNQYRGEIALGDLENVIHCRQKKGQIDYSYLIPRSQQTLGVV